MSRLPSARVGGLEDEGQRVQSSVLRWQPRVRLLSAGHVASVTRKPNLPFPLILVPLNPHGNSHTHLRAPLWGGADRESTSLHLASPPPRPARRRSFILFLQHLCQTQISFGSVSSRQPCQRPGAFRRRQSWARHWSRLVMTLCVVTDTRLSDECRGILATGLPAPLPDGRLPSLHAVPHSHRGRGGDLGVQNEAQDRAQAGDLLEGQAGFLSGS